MKQSKLMMLIGVQFISITYKPSESHPASYFVCQVGSATGLGSDLGVSMVGLSVDLAECHEWGLHDDSFLLK